MTRKYYVRHIFSVLFPINVSGEIYSAFREITDIKSKIDFNVRLLAIILPLKVFLKNFLFSDRHIIYNSSLIGIQL
jgi:hypothetical protein